MQTKATMRYYFLSTRIAIVRKIIIKEINWWSKRMLSSPPLHKHITTQLHVEQFILKITGD